MDGLNRLLGVLDTRAFSSLWYWLLLAGLWSWLGRGALGVPSDLVRRVAAGGALAADRHRLLDWLSLVTPRWHVGPREGVLLVGLNCFAVSSLAVAGFALGSVLAQALVLLLAPLGLLAAMRVRLAGKLARIVEAAGRAPATADDQAGQAARMILRHLRMTMILSVVSISLTALWATRWLALHPNGL